MTGQLSPGAWTPPRGVNPGWNWLPPHHGVRPRPDRAPRWVRVWRRTPLLDRYAYVWMWHHGALELVPTGDRPGPAGVREPRRPLPPSGGGGAARERRT